MSDVAQAMGGEVTLVIDDGPSPATTRMLDMLEAGGHRAVLFLLGCEVAGREASLIDAIRRGFALGNHSFSHPNFSEITVEVARREILDTEARIDALYARAGVARPGKWFRFPYLDSGGERHDDFQRLLDDLGFSIPEAVRMQLDPADRQRRDWPSTVVTRDWALPPLDEFNAIMQEAQAGSVVEYHDKVETVERLCAPLVEALEEHALRAVVPAPGIQRVFLVSWWMDTLGGMERHICELACALVRSGVRVDYFSEMPLPPGNAYRSQMERLGVRVHAPSARRARANEWRRAVLGHPLVRWMTAWRRYAGLERLTEGDLLSAALVREMERVAANDGKPDVVHVHGSRLGQAWLLEWAQRRGVPSMYTEHVAIADMGGPWEAIAPALAMTAGVLSSVSSHACASLQSVLPEARPIALSNHIVHESASGNPDAYSPYRWVCVARLERHKGIDVLLRALALCLASDPEYEVVLAGDGSEREALQALAHSLGISQRVQFLGMLPQEALSSVLHAAGGVVLASRTEGLPVSLVEAMAHRKAIIATRVGGIPELLHDGESAVLVAPDDAAALAEAMRRVSTNDGLREQLAEAALARFRASRYHEGAVIPDMLALYHAAIGDA
ncbi:MAG: glycosyltransferase [Gemmatimonadaceae bacterium]|nr:glycosyltransferase [Gemmatimonadaceae bacterium]